jgi:ketosteroid isomerase-like protein
MPEESTTPDLVELTGRVFQALSSRDIDAVMSFLAPDAVSESRGLGTSFEGQAAIRRFIEEWTGAYDQFDVQPEEIVDLGCGVTLAVFHLSGRLVGSTSPVEWRPVAAVGIWVDGMIERLTTYLDIDEARAAAERRAEERGRGG